MHSCISSVYDENMEDAEGRYPVLNSALLLVAPGRGFNSYFEIPKENPYKGEAFPCLPPVPPDLLSGLSLRFQFPNVCPACFDFLLEFPVKPGIFNPSRPRLLRHP